MTVSGYVCRALGMPKLKCHQRRTRREQVYAYYWSLFMHIMPEMWKLIWITINTVS